MNQTYYYFSQIYNLNLLYQSDGRESPSFEGLLDPDTVDGEKQEVEPKSVSVNSRNKIMGAAALAVLLIVGVSVVAWHFTKQERKLLKVHT